MENNWSHSEIHLAGKNIVIHFIQMQPGAISWGITRIQLLLVNESRAMIKNHAASIKLGT